VCGAQYNLGVLYRVSAFVACRPKFTSIKPGTSFKAVPAAPMHHRLPRYGTTVLPYFRPQSTPFVNILHQFKSDFTPVSHLG